MSFALAPYIVSGSISLYLGYKSLQNYYNQPFEYLELEAQEIEELGSLDNVSEIKDDNNKIIIKDDNNKIIIKEDDNNKIIIKEDDNKDENDDKENVENKIENLDNETVDDKNENIIKDEVIDKISDKVIFNVLEDTNKEVKNTPVYNNKKLELLKEKNLDKYDEKYPNKLDIGLISMENFDGRKVLPPIGTKPKVNILPPIGETKELDFVELKPKVYIPKKNKKKNKKNRNRK